MTLPEITSNEQANLDNYFPALENLTQHIVEATHQVVARYQQQQLLIRPQDLLYLYSRWLGFIVGEKVIGDKAHLQRLITDTLQKHTQQGKELCQIVSLGTESDEKVLEELIDRHGLISIPVLKLAQFISASVKQILDAQPLPHTKRERRQQEQPLQTGLPH